jgi:hypothetical protein
MEIRNFRTIPTPGNDGGPIAAANCVSWTGSIVPQTLAPSLWQISGEVMSHNPRSRMFGPCNLLSPSFAHVGSLSPELSSQ